MRQSKTLKICANHLGRFGFYFLWFGTVWLGFLVSDFWLWAFLCRLLAVVSSMSVQEHAGNEKSCVWHASDFADGELKDELFCIRFASVESEYRIRFWLVWILIEIELVFVELRYCAVVLICGFGGESWISIYLHKTCISFIDILQKVIDSCLKPMMNVD